MTSSVAALINKRQNINSLKGNNSIKQPPPCLIEMSHLRVDYLKLKQAAISVNCHDLSKADQCFAACIPTSKIAFNRGVLRLWAHDSEGAKQFFKEAFKLDKFLSVAAFYLGCLVIREEAGEAAAEWFNEALIGFRDIASFIDYSQIGMSFILHREDVQFNLASILHKLHGEFSDLFIESIKSLSLDSIRFLLSKEQEMAIREPPWIDRRMIFNLLPNLDAQTLELSGPEHIGLLEGERYLGSFTDAIERSVTQIICIVLL
jgi:hypothetical protein